MKSRRSMAVTALVIAIALGIRAFAAMPQNTLATDDTETPAGNITLIAAETRFSDVASGAWYAEAIAYCSENDIMNGTSDTGFSPNESMTRAMLATVLYRLAGSPTVSDNSFTDVEAGMWYTDAITWAEENGIVSGYGNGIFGTNDPITREQITTILWRHAETPDASTAAETFADSSNISDWARQSVSWAVDQEIVGGKPGNIFDPAGNATRAEVATILYRYLSDGEVGHSPEHSPPVEGVASTVYMTTDISPEGLMAVYEALDRELPGNVAVKVHTGESENSNYLRPDFIRDLVQFIDGTIVECNTAYGGSRASTAMHRQLAIDHGFTAIADVDIMDADGYISLPVVGGTQLTENFVGANFANYDSFLVLSHFKGHAMGGFGGAIKNISIGIASAAGKSWIHTGGNSMTSPWGGDQDAFLESMAEAGKSVVDSLDGNILYINVMNRLSVDCDCNGNPSEPDMHDIGILASYDPVALDRACVDLVYAAEDGQSLVARIESRNAVHVLEHGEAIGLGSQTYEIVSIDN